MNPLRLSFAAVVAVAALVGIALGASWNGSRWEAKYESREMEWMHEKMQAEKELADAQAKIVDAARELRNARINRVQCVAVPASGAAGVPADRADAGVGGDGALPTARDIGPAMRECIALQQRVSAYGELR